MKNEYLQEYLKTNLRACQLRQLEILKVIDGICRRHGIEYWLDGGTLLGAVRHKGFIPWDDDIDVAMTVKGLSEFCRVAQAELPAHLFLQNKQTDPHTKEPITKIRDLNSLYIETGDVFSADYEKGVYVDIFPFEPCASLPFNLHKKLTKGISKSYSILTKQHYYSARSTAELFWFGFKYLLFSAIWKLCNALSRKDRYLNNIPINNGYGIRHEISSVFPLGAVSFEGVDLPAPNNPDKYLKDLYHDYMHIPPEDKRVVHARFFMDRLVL